MTIGIGKRTPKLGERDTEGLVPVNNQERNRIEIPMKKSEGSPRKKSREVVVKKNSRRQGVRGK